MAVDFELDTGEALRTASASSLLSGLTAFTVSLWVKPETLGGTAMSWFLNAIYDKDGNAERQIGMQGFFGTALQCYFYDTTDTKRGGAVGITLTTGEWQHLVFTYDGSTVRGYRNGVVGGTTYSIASKTIQTKSNHLLLGAKLGGVEKFYDGLVIDRAIYNRAWSQEEISRVYNNRLAAVYIPEGRIQYWPLDSPGDGIYHDVANGDYGLRDEDGALPATIDGAPEWSHDSPGLHWPSPPIVVDATGALPIARWISVPFRRVPYGGSLTIGVVPLSKYNIDKVVYTISGQGHSSTPVEVNAFSWNQDDHCFAYNVTISASDFTSPGNFTMSAKVYADDGSTADANSYGGGVGLDDLSFRVDQDDSLPSYTGWVDPVAGDDETGVIEDEEYPFETIHPALKAMCAYMETEHGVYKADGCVIKLKAGNIVHGRGADSTHITTSDEWVYVQADDGLAPEDVVLSTADNYSKCRRYCLRGVKVSGDNIFKYQTGTSYNDDVLWVDDGQCIGPGMWEENSHPLGCYPGSGLNRSEDLYLTDTLVQDTDRGACYYPGTDFKLIRNCAFRNIGNDALESVHCVWGIVVDNVDPGETAWHADFWQHKGIRPLRNVLIGNAWCTGLKYQGLMFNADSNLRHGVAFVNLYLYAHDDTTHQLMIWSGSVVHMLLWQIGFRYEGGVEESGSAGACTFQGDSMGYSAESDLTSHLTELDVRACYFDRLRLLQGIGDLEQWPDIDENDFHDCNYRVIGGFRPWLYWGEGKSNAEPGLDELGKPEVDSVLRDRVDPLLVPFDARSHTRAPSGTTIGPYEYSLPHVRSINKPVHLVSLVAGGTLVGR